MKFYVTLILVLTGPFLHSQHFTEAPQTPPFITVSYSVIAVADVDGNNTQDFLITGAYLGGYTTKLYLNDGNGNFTHKPDTHLPGGFLGSVNFADVDGNGTQDLLITGISDTVNPRVISKLYINDGLGNFTEKMDTPFKEVSMSAAAFADVDGNNTLDVLISGSGNYENIIPRLYLNDGNGNFTEKTGTPFPKLYFGSIAFADVDGNNTQDVFITGVYDLYPRYTPNDYYANLYLNDGKGNFTEKMNTPFKEAVQSSIAFADVDENGAPDLLITGRGRENTPNSKLYLNDGTGNFTEEINTPFDPVSSSSVAFADVDGNNTQDVLITGENDESNPISKLYLNDGNGNFFELMDTPFVGVHESSIAFADVDGNNTPDVLITGHSNDYKTYSKLYLNNGNISLEEAILKSHKTLTIFPNPVIGQEIQISYPASKDGNLKIEVFDLRGRLLLRDERTVNEGFQNLSLDIPALPEGTYLIHLYDGENRWSEKFIVI